MTHIEFKEARRKLGLTQLELAEMLASDLKTVQRWEADPSLDYARPVPPLVARVVGWFLDGFEPD